MRSNWNSLPIRRPNRSGSSLFGALRKKIRRRESRRKMRSLLVENLEHRHLLAALVGVDFDVDGLNKPTNWEPIGYR